MRWQLTYVVQTCTRGCVVVRVESCSNCHRQQAITSMHWLWNDSPHSRRRRPRCPMSRLVEWTHRVISLPWLGFGSSRGQLTCAHLFTRHVTTHVTLNRLWCTSVDVLASVRSQRQKATVVSAVAHFPFFFYFSVS